MKPNEFNKNDLPVGWICPRCDKVINPNVTAHVCEPAQKSQPLTPWVWPSRPSKPWEGPRPMWDAFKVWM